jgi:predicted nucleic acid-binding protein
MISEISGKFTIDSNVIIKALVPPLRRKDDDIYHQQMNLHTTSVKILEKIITEKIVMYIPSVVLIEVGAVVSRITNNKKDAMEAVEKVRLYSSKILFDYDILENTISTAIDTKASGFDNIINCFNLSKLYFN